MVEIAVPKPWINHSMAELGIRTKYGVTVVGIMQDGNVNVEFNPTDAASGECTIDFGGSE